MTTAPSTLATSETEPRSAVQCDALLSVPPYHAEAAVVIYHGDCRQILPHLGKFDLLLTDPPYGIGAGQKNFGKWRTSRMVKGDWDAETPPAWLMAMLLDCAEKHIIWGGNYYEMPPSRQFLVWNKGAGFRGRDFAECEQAWCSMDGNARMFDRDPLAMGDYREKEHPTMKPVPLMQWCIQQAGDVQTILDPFAGSGTTGVAAKNLGKRAVLIEREERYCEIAARRLSQDVLPLFSANVPSVAQSHDQ